MKTFKIQITVLENWEGFIETANVVNAVLRTIRVYKIREYDFHRKVYTYNNFKTVKKARYMNKDYHVFYIENYGHCISI